MTKLAAFAALALSTSLFVAPPAARAATATGQFDVTINLTSACVLGTLPTAHFAYTSGQPDAATFSSSFTIRCTNGLNITSIALDSSTLTDAATNLNYTLALGAVPTTGTGVLQTIAITGTMAGGQGGTCTDATCTNASSDNKRRVLTITY